MPRRLSLFAFSLLVMSVPPRARRSNSMTRRHATRGILAPRRRSPGPMTTHRNRCGTALIALLTPLLAGLPASGATVLYQTGFEPPTFQAGSPLNGQGGFLGFLNEDVATVST